LPIGEIRNPAKAGELVTRSGKIIIIGATTIYLLGDDLTGALTDAAGEALDAFGVLKTDESSSPEITFGHGERHLEGTGLSQEEVEEAIEKQIGEVADEIPVGEFFKGTVVVRGQNVPYHGYKVSGGRIAVGTYGFESSR